MTTQTPNQPLASVLLTGSLGIIVVLTLAALCILPFEQHFFTGWVGIAFMCATPTQVILNLFWHNNLPKRIGDMPQPLKGISLTLITVVAGAFFTLLLSTLVGQNYGDTPMFIQYTILTVVTVLWLIPIWHAWPFSLVSKNPIIIGLVTLFATYVLAYIVWFIFFDYTALAHIPTPNGEIVHPLYHAEIDPKGLFDSWVAMTFAVTTAGVIVIHSLFDFWPINKLSMGRPQPVRGLIGTVYVLLFALIVRWFFTDFMGMEQVSYMIQVPVCMLFGAFLVNNMMQFSLFPNLKQPYRGFALLACSIIAGLIMYRLYSYAAYLFVGHELISGPAGGWELELWIATAMLGVTFPMVFLVSGFFDFWLLKKTK